MKSVFVCTIAFILAGTAAAESEVFGENEIAEDVHAIEAEQAEPIDHMDAEPGRPEFGKSAIILKQPPPLGASRESADTDPADAEDAAPVAPEPDTFIVVEEAGTGVRVDQKPEASDDHSISDEETVHETAPAEEDTPKNARSTADSEDTTPAEE